MSDLRQSNLDTYLMRLVQAFSDGDTAYIIYEHIFIGLRIVYNRLHQHNDGASGL